MKVSFRLLFHSDHEELMRNAGSRVKKEEGDEPLATSSATRPTSFLSASSSIFEAFRMALDSLFSSSSRT